MSIVSTGHLRVFGYSALAVAWIGSVVIGLTHLTRYETTPGLFGSAPLSWPMDSPVRRADHVPNVLMAVHPKCPCSRASLAVLGEILKRSPAGASVRLLEYRPADVDRWWTEAPSSIASLVKELGAERVDDPGGLIASKFGLATSGATIAFDATGRERFHGGLNSARAQTRLSPGGLALLAILRGEEPGTGTSQTFGCSLRDREAPGQRKGKR